MNSQPFTTSFLVDRTPEETFAVINDVRAWWTGEIEGGTTRLGDEFTYRVPGVHYSKMKIIELVPGRRVVWRVLDARLDYVDRADEWTGTHITFDVSQVGDQTKVLFSHLGLVPDFECFDACSNAWGSYINGSLRTLLTTQQ